MRGLLGAVTALVLSGCAIRTVQLFTTGHARELRATDDASRALTSERPGVLLLALDGVDRGLLYDMLRAGELPALARLLAGKEEGRFPHAWFAPTYLSTLPSSTMVAWVTALTGVPPARHGIAGNEFFIRERRQFAAPVPVTIDDADPVLACYTDDYVDNLRLAPSVYERMRERDPGVRVWVAMQQFHAGADRLLLTDRAVIAKAFAAFIEDEVTRQIEQKHSRDIYEKLDDEIVEVVVDELATREPPDVLTVYLSGTDSYAHVADEGPDPARREYLREVTDPLFAKLEERLRARDALADRWVVVTSDHGHTEVLHDDRHSLATEGPDEPPALLVHAGFRVRPFELAVPEDADFQAVLAYQGAMAYVYVADRSTCLAPGTACDWTRPPRFHEDVLALADAFYRNNRDGHVVPALRETLDLVLARQPRPVAEDDLPFQVYVGGGRLEPVARYLRRHPRPAYVDLDARLRDLAVGPHGERAGDVILLAHNGDRARPEDRYYFASRYHSWHGSPSARDSRIPLIIAHPERSTDQIRDLVAHALSPTPYQQRLTDVLLALREAPRATVARLGTPALPSAPKATPHAKTGKAASVVADQ